MTKIIPLLQGGDNCYILENGGRAALVDTGRKRTRKRLLKALAPWNIELILLTHGHFDHIYNAAFLAREYNAKIALSEADLELARDNRIHEIHSRGLLGYFIRKVSVASINRIRTDAFEPSFFLRDGQALDAYGFDGASIIALPGHTEGSVGILCGGACIAGDSVMSMGGVSAARIAEDFEKADQSVKVLRETGAEVFYPGHGGPIPRKKLLAL